MVEALDFLCKAKKKATDNDNLESKIWYNGYIAYEYSTASPFMITMMDTMLDYVGKIEVDENTICRPTRIYDKDYGQIYENDIVLVESYTENNQESGGYIGVVTYDESGCWALSTPKGNLIRITTEMEFTNFCDHCKVIGNIIDEPNFSTDNDEWKKYA